MTNRRGSYVTPLYLMHTVTQALVSLVTPIALGVGISYWLVSYRGVGTWLYAVLILVGVGLGLWSMLTFILRAMRALEALERQHAAQSGDTSSDRRRS